MVNGSNKSVSGVLAFLTVWMAIGAPFVARAADDFPYDREMILDARRMGTPKRLPILTVAPDGNAVIDLWCRTVQGRVQVVESGIRIEAAPLPEQLPTMMVRDQCTPERMLADQDLIAALTQVTNWSANGETLTLTGPVTLRFHASSH